jgi:NHL repeat
VVQASVSTWQAYNNWGGESLYEDALGLPGGHASEVSFDRPYGDGFGSGEYFYFEHFLVQWLESRGYDATYLTNVDVHRDPSLLAGQKLFISSGHDEYWSRGEKDAIDTALAGGLSIAYLTADESYWQIRLEPSRGDKRPWRTEVCYKDAAPAHDPQAGTNLITMRWRDVEVGAPEQATHGVMSDGWEFADLPWIVQGSGSWVYAGTGLQDGDSIPLLVGYESDRIFAEFPQPAGLEVLARSPVVSFDSGDAGPNWHNATVYTAPSGAFVFAAGVVQWSYGLSAPGVADARVQRITDNLFQRAHLVPSLPGDSFGAGPPRIDSAGAAASVSTLSGASHEEGLVDGPAARARFRRPVGIAVDARGNIYIADSGNHAVRMIAADAERTVTTLAGPGALNAPYGVALGPDGSLYVAEFGKNRVSRIAPDVSHTVTVWAGSLNGNSGTVDGNGTAARFNMPVAIAAVGSDLYVVDSMTSRVRRIDAAQNVTTVVGLNGKGHTDGEGANARLYHPTGIAAGTDALYVVDSGNRVIRRIALDGRYTVTTIAGSGQGGYADAPVAEATLMPLIGAAVLDGAVLVADAGSARLRKIVGGKVTTWAGSGRSGADDGSALSASFNVPTGLAVLPDGTVAVADQGGSTIRLVRSR